MHAEKEGRVPEWFELEGFTPAVDPDFDSWTVTVHGTAELPAENRPSGRVLCEVRGLPDVRVAVHLAVATGDLVGLEVFDASLLGADREPRPISARLLRKLPFGDLERAARETLRWELAVRHHHEEDHIRASIGDEGRRLRESLADVNRPGRRGREDAPFASLAAEYVKRLGGPSPVKATAEALSCSKSKVSNMLNEARRRDLLTRPPPGKAGGHLTRKAIELLEEDTDNA